MLPMNNIKEYIGVDPYICIKMLMIFLRYHHIDNSELPNLFYGT